MAHYHTVIFDFDGTIAATLESARIAYNDIASSSGFKQIEPEDIPILREEKLSHILKILGISKLQAPGLLVKGRALMREQLASIPLVDGMRQVLLDLKSSSIQIGILTSNSSENVQLFLAANELTGTIDFVQSTTTLSGKSKCLKRITKNVEAEGRNKSGILYVGDEVRDIESCHKAGIAIAAVTWGFNARTALEDAKPAYLTDETSELRSLILGE